MGWLLTPYDELAALLAASAKFRSITGAADAAAALAFIHYPEACLFIDTPPVRPWAIIAPPLAVETYLDWNQAQQGALELDLEFLPDPGQSTEKEQFRSFCSDVETICEEMRVLANTPKPGGAAQYWNLERVTLAIPPGFANRDENKNNLYLGITLICHWQ